MILMLTAATPSPALAEPIPDAADMQALETGVPAQPWYPDGYYDIRIAAEAEVAEAPSLPDTASRKPGDPFNLVDCRAEKVAPDVGDPLLVKYGNVALDTARLRAGLAALHYPAALYADPLLAFEKARIASANAGIATTVNSYAQLAAATEANRLRAAPDLPQILASGTCGAPAPVGTLPGVKQPSSAVKPSKSAPPTRVAAPPPRPAMARPPSVPSVIFSTLPGAGELLMINAFAFKVCIRKQPNPWDRFACKWNEIETGVAKPMAGRFVYQIKWPDGTVRKGTREIIPANGGAPVTFKKVGS